MKDENVKPVLPYAGNEPPSGASFKGWIAVGTYLLGCAILGVSIVLTIAFPGGSGLGFNDLVPEAVVRSAPLIVWGVTIIEGIALAIARVRRRRNLLVALAALLSAVIWVVLFTYADGLAD